MSLNFDKEYGQLTDVEKFWVKEVRDWLKNGDYLRSNYYVNYYLSLLKSRNVNLI